MTSQASRAIITLIHAFAPAPAPLQTFAIGGCDCHRVLGQH